MLIQNDGKSNAIIGEAALRLVLVRKDINIFSLIAMLEHMATSVDSDTRLRELTEARIWLKQLSKRENVNVNEPYIQALMDFN